MPRFGAGLETKGSLPKIGGHLRPHGHLLPEVTPKPHKKTPNSPPEPPTSSYGAFGGPMGAFGVLKPPCPFNPVLWGILGSLWGHLGSRGAS